MKQPTILVLIFAAALLSSRCSPSLSLSEKSGPDAPSSFGPQLDSGNVASMNWREFFQDSSLVDLIDIALKNNPDVLIALQRIEAARAGVQFAKGVMRPVVNGAAVPAIRRFGLYTMDGAGNSTTDILPDQIVPTNLPDYFIGLQTAWEVDVAGKLRNKKRAAAARYLASVEGRNWLTTILVADVALAYFDLASLDIELEIIKETIAIQQSASIAIAAQKEAGMANEAAVKQFNAQLLNTRAMEIDAQQRIVEAESRINLLLGRYPQPIQRNTALYTEPITSTRAAGIPAELLRNRPDIRQAELELVAARADLASAKAAFYPSVIISGGTGFQAFKTDLLFTTPESFMFNLIGGFSAPLLNRSSIKAQFSAANAFQAESLYNYQKTVLTGYMEVYSELNRIENLDRMSAFKDEESRLLTETIDNVRDLFNSRRATYIEVLVSQQNALEARLDYLDIKRQQLSSRVNLYKALGGGWR